MKSKTTDTIVKEDASMMIIVKLNLTELIEMTMYQNDIFED